MLVLFTDTDTDITPEMAREYGYRLISMPYSLDGKTVYPYVDFEKFDAEAFYQKMREGAMPTTSAISVQQYLDYFEPVFANGDDIFYVHFSANMTNTFDFMNQAVAQLKEKYPERKFYELDTMGITLVSLNIVLAVGDMFKAGATPEEVLEWGKEGVYQYACYFTADDLKFFHRSGRVSGLSATMGTLLGIRPIISIGAEGTMGSVGKEKGRRKTIDRLAQYVADLGDDVKNHRVLIGQCGNMELAHELEAAIKAKLGDDLQAIFIDVNPTAGSHCGPDTVGVSFHAIHR